MPDAEYSPQQIVRDGYDKIAQRYLECSTDSPAKVAYLNKVLERLPKSAEVLELGCGSGKSCTKILSDHAQVIGVDISAAQLALAKEMVPKARLIHADMMTLSFDNESFDAITAFYSIIHLPREMQHAIITRIYGWLRPGGYFLANFGATDDPESMKSDWFGAKMYWSSYDEEITRKIMVCAGFELIEAEVIVEDEDGNPVKFLWVFSRRSCSQIVV